MAAVQPSAPTSARGAARSVEHAERLVGSRSPRIRRNPACCCGAIRRAVSVSCVTGESSCGNARTSPPGDPVAITLSMAPMTSTAHTVQILRAKERLVAAGGGYEVVHESPGLELGVYVLVAPEPDRQQPHDDDEIYVVLEGVGDARSRGGAARDARRPGDVRAGRRRAPVRGYEQLSVLVIFEKTQKS